MTSTPETPDTLIEKYRDEAEKVSSPEATLPVPIHIFLGEAADLVKFVEHYWEPAEQPQRPGLKGSRLPKGTAKRLDELQQVAERANHLYNRAVNPPLNDVMEQANECLAELTATLEYYYDDGKDTKDDTAIAHFADLHDHPSSHDSMALALSDYAQMAEEIRSELAAIPTFNVVEIDRAKGLADELRLRDQPGLNERHRQAQRLRDQLFSLLQDEIARVRSEARFVFREHPQVVREATSDYQRRVRAARRRAQKRAAAEDAAGSTTTTTTPSAAAADRSNVAAEE